MPMPTNRSTQSRTPLELELAGAAECADGQRYLQGEPVYLTASLRNREALEAMQRPGWQSRRPTYHIAPQGRRWWDYLSLRFYQDVSSGRRERLVQANCRAWVDPVQRHPASGDPSWLGRHAVTVPLAVPPEVSASLPAAESGLKAHQESG
jgi:hypothetical protein